MVHRVSVHVVPHNRALADAADNGTLELPSAGPWDIETNHDPGRSPHEAVRNYCVVQGVTCDIARRVYAGDERAVAIACAGPRSVERCNPSAGAPYEAVIHPACVR